MSTAGRRMVRNGEIALVCGAALLSRMDFERDEHAVLLAQCLRLAGDLPDGASLVDGGRLSRLRFRLLDYAAELRRGVRLPSGERDWNEAMQLQGELRRAVDDCHAALFARCFAIWDRVGGGPPGPTGSGGALLPASQPPRGHNFTDAAPARAQGGYPGRNAANPERAGYESGKSVDGGAGESPAGGETPAHYQGGFEGFG